MFLSVFLQFRIPLVPDPSCQFFFDSCYRLLPVKRHSSCIPLGIFFFSPSNFSAMSHPLMCSPSHVTCAGRPFALPTCLPVYMRASVTLSPSGLVAGASVAHSCIRELTGRGEIAKLFCTWQRPGRQERLLMPGLG